MPSLWRRGVAVVCYATAPPTVEYPARRVVPLLRDVGFDVQIVARAPERSRGAVDGLTLWLEPGAPAIAQRIARLRPELLYIEATAFGVVLADLARRSWIRNPHYAGRPVNRALQRVCVRRFDAVTFGNPHHRQLWKVPEARVVDLPSPVDVDFWRAVPAPTEDVWLDRGLPVPPGPVLVYVANLTRLKRQVELVEDLAPLLHERPDVRLVLIGGDADAETPPRLAQVCDQHDVGEQVVRTGWLPPEAIRAALAWASASVVHTALETQCMVMYESLAAGVPVLMTDLPELRTQLPFVPTHSNGAELRANVTRMLDDRAQRDEQLALAGPRLDWVDQKRHDAVFYEEVERLLKRTIRP